MSAETYADLHRALERTNGILRLEPAWVARDWLPPGRRLGLADSAYDVGERGFICERWLGSTTQADNRVGPPDEGLSYITDDGARILLRDAVKQDPGAIIGAEYAAHHEGLGRLAKIFDYGSRTPFHIHPRPEHAALVGRNSKEEAYYFPEGPDLGPHPEAFFGLHQALAGGRGADILLPYLVDWDSDLILRHSIAHLEVAGEGFHIPAGILHAPGTALTIELQEDSDAMAMLQAVVAGSVISKDLLYKDIHRERRERLAEAAVLEWLDWDANCDPYFHENHHIVPTTVDEPVQSGGRQEWLFQNGERFNGKRLTLLPGATYTSVERGVYNVLVWQGTGRFEDLEIEGGNHALDELLVCHDRAVEPHHIVNSGTEDMVLIKFFGPDINPDAPSGPRWPASD